LATDTPKDSGAANFGRVDVAGLYRIQTANGPAGSVAVNLLDPTETDIAVRDSLRIAGQEVAGAPAAEGPLELWPYLVLAALALLSVEWLINAWQMRV